MQYSNIKLEKDKGVATIRLDRPNALNAVNWDLLDELSDATADVAGDEEIKLWWSGARGGPSAPAQT